MKGMNMHSIGRVLFFLVLIGVVSSFGFVTFIDQPPDYWSVIKENAVNTWSLIREGNIDGLLRHWMSGIFDIMFLAILGLPGFILFYLTSSSATSNDGEHDSAPQ